MGWLDKAKVALGIVDPEDVEDEGPPRAEKRVTLGRDGVRDKAAGRPSLEGFSAAPQETLEDVLAAREAGDHAGVRALLRRIDRGRGLRVLLRAAAALEAEDEGELRELLPQVAAEEPRWKLPLQLAAALADERSNALRALAEERGAPPWALAWMDACQSDEPTRRRGLVKLMFADPALARTVASRDLHLEGAESDPAAGQRYVSFAHGRDCIRRFGAPLVHDVFERAEGRR